MKNKLKEKESRNVLKEDESLYNELFKYLQEVSEENKSLPDRVDESLTGVSGEEPGVLMRINSSRDLSSKGDSIEGKLERAKSESKKIPENQVRLNQKVELRQKKNINLPCWSSLSTTLHLNR